MSHQFFSIFRAVLAALITAVAAAIINYFNQFSEPDYSHSYEYQ